MADEIVKFPGNFRRVRSIKYDEVMEQPEPSDLMVWEICPYLKSVHDNNTRCIMCPHHENDPELNKYLEEGEHAQRACRSRAETVCRTVMAVQAKEKDDKKENEI